MNNIQSRNIAILLIVLMAATRMHHFGSSSYLPDASLAIFMLAGILAPRPLLFGALLFEAAVLDYVAIGQLGVNDYCMSPAYWFLIPTYAVMWGAGRFYAKRYSATWHGLSLFLLTAFAATSMAFVISSGSFFLLSGRFADLSALQYIASVAKYYLPYLSSAFLYLTIAAGIQITAISLTTRHSHNA
jgi:hypothetical protein